MSKCICKFKAVGQPMNLNGCTVHEDDYTCDLCPLHLCAIYRPSREFVVGKDSWPVCVCGHVAQDHNVRVISCIF
jgi:hypothetical protein